MASLKVGDKLLVRGAYGRAYPMENFKGNNVVIIGGGCGVAPLKGSIEYLEGTRFSGKRAPDGRRIRGRLCGFDRRNHKNILLFGERMET